MMTRDEFQEYWFPARDLMPKRRIGVVQASQELANLFGYAYPKAGHWEDIQFTDDLRSKLVMLAGPHRNTIRKMLEIKQGKTNAEKTKT